MFDRREYYKANKQKQVERVRRWREENPEAYATQRKEQYRRRRQNNPIGLLLNAAKHRAKAKGVPFDIRSTDIEMVETCPVLGIRLRYEGVEFHADDSASLDRIVPELGYVKGNVIVVSWRANRIKCDASVDELRRIANFYEQCRLS